MELKHKSDLQNQEIVFQSTIEEIMAKLAGFSNQGKLNELLAKQKSDEDTRNALLKDLEDLQEHTDAIKKTSNHNFDDLNHRYIELETSFSINEQKISAHESVIEKLLFELEQRGEEARILKVFAFLFHRSYSHLCSIMQSVFFVVVAIMCV